MKKDLFINNQKGQGTVEYVLLLVLVISIVLGVMLQLNTSIAKWAASYFGDYYACLLENGELPSGGGSDNRSGECAQLYEPFTLAQGAPPNMKTNSSGGGSGNNGSGGANQRRGSFAPGSGSGTDGSESGGANYARVGSKSGGGSSGSGSNFDDLNARNSRSKIGGKEKKTYTGSSEFSLPSSATSGNSSSKTTMRIGLDNRMQILREDSSSDSSFSSTTIRKNSSSTKTKEDKIRIKRKLASEKSSDDDTELTFGHYIRIIIIAAILIALFVLLGGQALQISSSWE